MVAVNVSNLKKKSVHKRLILRQRYFFLSFMKSPKWDYVPWLKNSVQSSQDRFSNFNEVVFCPELSRPLFFFQRGCFLSRALKNAFLLSTRLFSVQSSQERFSSFNEVVLCPELSRTLFFFQRGCFLSRALKNAFLLSTRLFSVQSSQERISSSNEVVFCPELSRTYFFFQRA